MRHETDNNYIVNNNLMNTISLYLYFLCACVFCPVRVKFITVTELILAQRIHWRIPKLLFYCLFTVYSGHEKKHIDFVSYLLRHGLSCEQSQ